MSILPSIAFADKSSSTVIVWYIHIITVTFSVGDTFNFTYFIHSSFSARMPLDTIWSDIPSPVRRAISLRIITGSNERRLWTKRKEIEKGGREREGGNQIGRKMVNYSHYIFDQKDKVVLSKPLACTSQAAQQNQLHPVHCWADHRQTLSNISKDTQLTTPTATPTHYL